MKAVVIHLSILVTALSGAAVTGCNSNQKPSASGYSTLGRDPTRDASRATLLNAEGIAAMNGGEWDKAEQAFKAALEADVTFGPAHNNLGKSYFHLNKLYLAAWEFQYAAKLMPNQPEPRNNLGLVLEQAGKLDDAIEKYDDALVLEPDNIELLGNATRCRVRRGDRDEKTVELLQKLVMRESRSDWLEWAQEQLALRRKPTTN